MDALKHVDWVTLVLGIILGIPVAYVIGILSPMHTEKVSRYLESRKLLKKDRTREKALRIFRRIEAFKDGRLDRYAFYLILSTTGIIGVIVGSMFVMSVSHHKEDPLPTDVAFALVIAVLAIAFGLIAILGIYDTARKIDRFGDYKKEFEERWGPME